MPSPGKRFCYLHIGTRKTGSSSVQSFLLARRDALLLHGLLVPAAGLPPNGNHLPLVEAIFKPDVAPAQGGLVRSLEEEIANFPSHSVLISSESFETYGPSKRLSRVIDFFRARDYRIVLVCFVREQVGRLNASYAQGTKSFKRNCDVREFVDHALSTGQLSYSRWVRLAAEQGVEIVARPYDAATRDGGVVVKFLDMVGIGGLVPVEDERRINPSPGTAAVAAARTCMDRVHAELSTWTLRQRARSHRAMLSADAAFPSEPFWGLNDGLVTEIQDHYRDDNDAFARAVWGTTWCDTVATSGPYPAPNEIDRTNPGARGRSTYAALLENVWPTIEAIAKSRGKESA